MIHRRSVLHHLGIAANMHLTIFLLILHFVYNPIPSKLISSNPIQSNPIPMKPIPFIHPILSNLIPSNPIRSNLIQSNSFPSYPISSNPIQSNLIQSYSFPSYPIQSNLIQSYSFPSTLTSHCQFFFSLISFQFLLLETSHSPGFRGRVSTTLKKWVGTWINFGNVPRRDGKR